MIRCEPPSLRYGAPRGRGTRGVADLRFLWQSDRTKVAIVSLFFGVFRNCELNARNWKIANLRVDSLAPAHSALAGLWLCPHSFRRFPSGSNHRICNVIFGRLAEEFTKVTIIPLISLQGKCGRRNWDAAGVALQGSLIGSGRVKPDQTKSRWCQEARRMRSSRCLVANPQVQA
jgi:hypothetical protein